MMKSKAFLHKFQYMRFLYYVVQVPLQTLYEVFTRLHIPTVKSPPVEQKHSYCLRPRKPVCYLEAV